MKTRAHDYSVPSESLYQEKLSIKHKSMLRLTKKQNKLFNNNVGIIVSMNKVLAYSLSYIELVVTFLNIQKASNEKTIKLENFLKVFLRKKKTFQDDYNNIYWKLSIDDRDSYGNQFNLLMDKCDKGNRLIHEYFNRKYSVILLKSNQDVYRHILSYL